MHEADEEASGAAAREVDPAAVAAHHEAVALAVVAVVAQVVAAAALAAAVVVVGLQAVVDEVGEAAAEEVLEAARPVSALARRALPRSSSSLTVTPVSLSPRSVSLPLCVCARTCLTRTSTNS